MIECSRNHFLFSLFFSDSFLYTVILLYRTRSVLQFSHRVKIPKTVQPREITMSLLATAASQFRVALKSVSRTHGARPMTILSKESGEEYKKQVSLREKTFCICVWECKTSYFLLRRFLTLPCYLMALELHKAYERYWSSSVAACHNLFFSGEFFS